MTGVDVTEQSKETGITPVGVSPANRPTEYTTNAGGTSPAPQHLSPAWLAVMGITVVLVLVIIILAVTTIIAKRQRQQG